jgi:cell division protein FtsA
MHANKLEVDLFIISAFSNNVKNLKKVINEAGYEVNQIVASGIASASSVLKPEEKSSGVIVIDIGAGTTDIAFFKDNYLKGFEVIAKAGNKITEDLSRRLKLSLPYAEEIKKRYGCATYEADEKQDNIVLKEADNEFKNLNKNQINSIVEKSTNEILKDITGSLKKMKCLSSASCGVVLTGGTALLDGMIDKAENKLELPVRLGTPVGYTSKTNLSTPIWSTCLGLARYVLLGQDPSVEQKKIPLGSLIFIKQKIEDILTDYF